MSEERPTFREAYQQHFEKYGSCPIEDGTMGRLADHECEHGFVPGDTDPPCDCFSKEKGKR